MSSANNPILGDVMVDVRNNPILGDADAAVVEVCNVVISSVPPHLRTFNETDMYRTIRFLLTTFEGKTNDVVMFMRNLIGVGYNFSESVEVAMNKLVENNLIELVFRNPEHVIIINGVLTGNGEDFEDLPALE